MNADLSGSKQKKFNGSFLLLLLLLGGTLAVLCRQGFGPYEVFWANDIPLGALMESSSHLPAAIFTCWADFFYIGGPNVAFPPNLSTWCMALLSPEHHLKFYAPGSMFFLGFGTWFFFRQLRFTPVVCTIAGLGAGLNMHFLSNACWGLPQWNVCSGMIFIALGILVSQEIRPLWLKAVLAGFSTGMAVMEGFDVGAILSVYVGIFLAFLFLTRTEEPAAQRARKAALVGGLVVASAILISLSTIYTLVVTQISGTADDAQGQAQSPDDRWRFVTQWSMPKLESARVIIPGLFGYRLQEFTTSTNKAGSYWGRLGEDPHIQELESSDPQVRTNAAASLGLPPNLLILFGPDQDAGRLYGDTGAQLQEATKVQIRTDRDGYLNSIKGQLQRRHTGNGEYTGILVCLLAILGLANAGRKVASPYSAEERRAVWFWGGAALFSLLAAWGRFGFVYPLLYRIPFLTNIRSPMKFMHPMNICLIILSGYGLECLYRCWLSKPLRAVSFSRWWRESASFERKWIIGSCVTVALAAVACLAMQSNRANISSYLQRNGFDPDLSTQIAGFSIGEVGLFVIYLSLSAGVVMLALTRTLSGKRTLIAWAALSVIMICDLYRSDDPWIRYYNYKQKLSMNPVVELLRQKPWEHRVVARSSPIGGYDLSTNINFAGICHWWLENDYPYNDIQSLEIDQAPRMAVIDSSYLGNFMVRSSTNMAPATRLWQLTNTRYIFADAQMEGILNQFGYPRDSFRTVMRMDMVIKPNIGQVEDAGDMTVDVNSNGSLALIEFTRALPRAKLFANWQMMANGAALQTLGNPQFDPEKTVLVSTDTPVTQTPASTDADAGTVAITQYQSKDLTLQAEAKVPAVLLLNDHTADFWNVWVDDQPASILRCNYIMQGVLVPAGHHKIQFRYQPPRKMLYVSLSALAFGILLGGYVVGAHFMRKPPENAPASGKPKQASSKAA